MAAKLSIHGQAGALLPYVTLPPQPPLSQNNSIRTCCAVDVSRVQLSAENVTELLSLPGALRELALYDVTLETGAQKALERGLRRRRKWLRRVKVYVAQPVLDAAEVHRLAAYRQSYYEEPATIIWDEDTRGSRDDEEEQVPGKEDAEEDDASDRGEPSDAQGAAGLQQQQDAAGNDAGENVNGLVMTILSGRWDSLRYLRLTTVVRFSDVQAITAALRGDAFPRLESLIVTSVDIYDHPTFEEVFALLDSLLVAVTWHEALEELELPAVSEKLWRASSSPGDRADFGETFSTPKPADIPPFNPASHRQLLPFSTTEELDGAEWDLNDCIMETVRDLPNQRREARLLLRLMDAVQAGALDDGAAAAAAELLQQDKTGGLALLALAPAGVLDLLLGFGLWDYDPALETGRQLAREGMGDLVILGAKRGSRACTAWYTALHREPLDERNGAEAGEAVQDAEEARAAQPEAGGLSTEPQVPRLEHLALQSARRVLNAEDGSLLAGLSGLFAGYDSAVFAMLTYGLVNLRISASEESLRRLRP